MVLKRGKISKTLHSGYLFCNHCGGYYELKKNETPRDFLKCECGNALEYCRDRNTLDLKIISLHQNKKTLDSFEYRMLQRRAALTEVFPKVSIDDDYIANMQKEEELWDILDKENNINRQKEYLDIILEEERLMGIINQKKLRVNNPTFLDKIIYTYDRTDPTLILGLTVIILIIILFIVVFRA